VPATLGAGLGSVVGVRFHGRRTRGWVLGPTGDVPSRLLPVDRLVSPVPVFDPGMLEVLRWVAERYVAPLATVIGRASPPRVASEDPAEHRAAWPAPGSPSLRHSSPHGASSVLPGYRGAGALLRAIRDAPGSGPGGLSDPVADGADRPTSFTLRPAPEDEAAVCVEAVAACLQAGRRALVLVPEADPVPATVTALEGAFGDRVVRFVGGDQRARYRTWLAIGSGRFDVVVATRPGVFAPLHDLGLVYVARASHPALREDRAPYYHVREVAQTLARVRGGVCVLAAACQSAETSALGLPAVTPSGRRWPAVEVVRPGAEGRAPRLLQALRTANRAFMYSPLPGYGVARVCRTCGRPASCATCGGTLRQASGEIRCVVCAAPGRCATCGGTTFGVVRGGSERVEEWAAQVASVPVRRAARPRLPDASGEILVGGPADVRDLGTADLDLVAVLDADLAARRPGMNAAERALTVWMEAVGWARPSGRAIVQASDPSDPAVQALVRGNPDRFLERERRRREEAGFPVDAAVFRVIGVEGLEAALEDLPLHTKLISTLGERTVCLLAVATRHVPAFGRTMRALAASGVVTRVEAEPHL